MEGPVDLPENGGELLQRVNETYQGLFKLWADVFVPKLIYQPKWHRDDKDLNEGDLVYFQKDPDNPLGSKWIIGIVDQLIRSRDGRFRRVIVKYQNYNEETPRLTDRSVRKLIRIYDIDEYVLQNDLSEFLRRLDGIRPVEKDKDDETKSETSQVMCHNVTSAHVTCTDHSNFSGTWSLPAAPVRKSSASEVVQVASEILPWFPPTTGGRGQVPGGDIAHTNLDSSKTTPFPSTSSNPLLNSILLKHALRWNLQQPIEDIVPCSLQEDFLLMLEECYPTVDPCWSPEAPEDVDKLLYSTHLVLE